MFFVSVNLSHYQRLDIKCILPTQHDNKEWHQRIKLPLLSIHNKIQLVLTYTPNHTLWPSFYFHHKRKLMQLWREVRVTRNLGFISLYLKIQQFYIHSSIQAIVSFYAVSSFKCHLHTKLILDAETSLIWKMFPNYHFYVSLPWFIIFL